MNPPRTSRLEQIAFVALAAGLALIQVSIEAEAFLWIAAVLWIIIAVKDGGRPEMPAFALPLAIYIGITLVSVAFSLDRVDSFHRSKQLLLFLVVPMTARLARGDRATAVLNAVVALASVAALAGVFEFAVLHWNNLGRRPEGFLGHYMTYAGLIMLVLGASLARLLFFAGQRVWPAIAVPALAAALAVTFARNAWIGVLVAVTMLFALRNLRLLLLVPLLAAIFFLAVPGPIKQRVYSIADTHDATTRDRIAMWTSGLHIIRDHPLLGIGMNMMPRVYPQYKTADAVDPADARGVATRSHLHNVPMQIAAERGLPALAIWIWFVVVALRDLVRQTRQGPARWIAAAGVAAITSMLAAGMFEYNFGDSEFLILFLGLITLPFAAARPTNPVPSRA